MKLYVVTITRLVVCKDERQAREIAAKADNPEDVDEVIEVRDISDIPEVWRKFCPYGEGGDGKCRSAEQWWRWMYN